MPVKQLVELGQCLASTRLPTHPKNLHIIFQASMWVAASGLPFPPAPPPQKNTHIILCLTQYTHRVPGRRMGGAIMPVKSLLNLAIG
jgi:hypothetical protein